MNEKMAALCKLETFKIVEKPDNEPIIGCRWVYKVKKNKNN